MENKKRLSLRKAVKKIHQSYHQMSYDHPRILIHKEHRLRTNGVSDCRQIRRISGFISTVFFV
ncbi:hypothetical protein, partial [Bacillus sp. AFS073361]|uniref:hypothetical protein n=1 Tax=Bacillus sp. AFS073361 TaxID=2033511 RepID=UPI001C551A47